MTTPARANKSLVQQGRTLSIGSPGGSASGGGDHRAGELRAGEYIHYGKYRIEGVIGRGSFAVVYGAEHVALRRKVAIKIVHVTPHTSPAVVQRFQEEARIAALVRHPNVLETYDTGMLPGGSPFLVIERIEGDTLSSALERGPLPIRAVIEIGRQLARALTAIAAAGVVHRDIKPDNVMVRWQDNDRATVKIVDFGVSKRPSSPPIPGASRGELIGTPQYMPPEQLRGEEVDVRADVYAIGAVLYEAVTGRAPHMRQNFGDLMVAVLSEEVPRPRSLRPDCPEALEDILLTALERDRQRRFASPEQLVAALDEVADSFSAVAVAPSPPAREQADASAERPLPIEPALGPSHWVSQAPTVRPPSRTTPPPASLLQPSYGSDDDDDEDGSLASTRPFWRTPALRHAALGASAIAAAFAMGWALWPESSEPKSSVVASAPRTEEPVAAAPARESPTEAAGSNVRAAEPASRRTNSATGARTTSATGARTSGRAGASASTSESSSTASQAPRTRHSRASSSSETRASSSSDESGSGSSRRSHRSKSARSENRSEPISEAKALAPAVSDGSKAQRDQAMRDALSALAGGRVAQARASYREATRLDPTHAAAYRGLALAAIRLGQRSEAEDALATYRKLAPGALDAEAIAGRIEALGR